MRAAILAGAALLALAGCAGRNEPLVKNRYAAIEGGAPATPGILISATARPTPEAKSGVELLALSPQAQAALIKATGGNPPLRLSKPEEDERARIADRFDRRIVVALRPADLMPPGTRLMAARIEISPDADGHWRFVDWDRLEKDGAVIEVGTVSTEQKTGFNAELNLGIGGPIGSPKLGFEQSKQVNEEMVVRDDFVQSAAIDGNGSAWIDQRAGARYDLATNTQLDATFAIDPSLLRQVTLHVPAPLTTAGTPSAPAAVSIASVTVSRPDPTKARPICGTVRLTGWLRTIVKGAATYTEADDVIRIVPVRDSARFLLSPPTIEPLYRLAVPGGPALMVWFAGAARPTLLRLGGLDHALALRDWLRATGVRAGRLANARLGLSTGAGGMTPLTAAAIAGLVPDVLNREQIAAARAGGQGCEGGAAPVAPPGGGEQAEEGL